MVHVDMDMFGLPGDVLALLERAALEPLPCQPLSPKDGKCPQSRTKVVLVYDLLIQFFFGNIVLLDIWIPLSLPTMNSTMMPSYYTLAFILIGCNNIKLT